MLAHRGSFQDLNFVRPIGHYAKEDKILVSDRLVRVRHTCRYVNDIVPDYLDLVISNLNAGSALQHVLLVLHPVCVQRHAAAGFHNKSTHSKIRGLVGPDEYLRRRS